MHTLGQLKDAVRDGLRAVSNTMEDKAVVPGAGSFEVAALVNLESFLEKAKGYACPRVCHPNSLGWLIDACCLIPILPIVSHVVSPLIQHLPC